MRTMRLAICVAIVLLTLPQAGQAQDTFNSNSGEASCKTWKDRQGPCYANDPPPGPSDEPAKGKRGGVLLKGGVSVEDKGTGGTPMLKGGVSQGQQGAPGYPPPTASKQPASKQPVFVGSTHIENKTYTIRSEGPPGGAAWGAFGNPDRYYESFYGQVERRGSGYVFRITALRLPGGGTKAANIEVPLKKIQ